MNVRKTVLLLLTHGVAIVIGFAAGIYTLPILIAPAAPTEEEVAAAAVDASFTTAFRRDLEGSDALHWGEGDVSVGAESISFMGKLSPGPDYRLYLSPEFVETEEAFNRLKPEMVQVGDVKTFENFVVRLPANVDPTDYSAVIVWCESFGEFITSASYRP